MYITPETKSKQLIEKFGEKSLLVADEILEATKTYDWRTNKYSNYWLEVKVNIEKTLKEYETNVV
jgi:hypothetical protein